MKIAQQKNIKITEADLGVLNRKKFTISSVSAAVTLMISASLSSTLHSADIEIYKIPEDSVGTTTLMFMLDISGSMSSTDTGQTGSRLNRLKQGMRDVLYGSGTNEPLDKKIIIGLGVFEGNNGRINTVAKALGAEGTTNITNKKEMYSRVSRGNTYYYRTCTAWHETTQSCKAWGAETTSSSGVTGSTYTCYFGENCLVYYNDGQSRKRTHRDDLFDAVNALQPLGNTPTPYAYAEAAAYLMGTTTIPDPETRNGPAYFVDPYIEPEKKYYLSCNSFSVSSNPVTCISWSDWKTGYTFPNTHTKGAAGKEGGYDGFYYMGKMDSNGDSPFSGFKSSVAASKNGDKYLQPVSISDQKNNADKRECSGQGIYFLTDGQPVINGSAGESNGITGDAYKLMSKALDTKKDGFTCLASPLGDITTNTNNGRTWACIGKFAQALLNKDQNPTGLQIKTAVVGFGNDFTSTTGSVDVQNAKTWGEIGGGNWTAGNSSKDIVDSVNNFIKELNKDIPSMSTGSSTIPADSLSSRSILPYAYSPQLEPKVKPSELQQQWYGNLKKYHAVNNGIYANAQGTGDPVVKKSKLQDLADIWADKSIVYPEKTGVFAKHGALNRVLLGTTTTAEGKVFGRKILTDFEYDGTKAEASRYGRNLNLVRLAATYTTDAKTKTETNYAKGLLALFGYNIASEINTNGLNIDTLQANLRQLGSIQHSLPVLLTQEGKAVAKRVNGDVVVEYEGREDYVMYGSTQGLLHVLNASDGKEVFSFLPKEMIEKQHETFKENAGSTSNGKNALYYGIDGQWVSHSVYVAKDDGTLTVKSAARNVIGSTTDKENLAGKQWVYGGLRMGGRSYYSLDLTNINAPKLKFHIDPTTGKVYTPSTPDGKAFSAISNMGQSWSKPTLAYVNWQGTRKLVMFVGGGYDAGGPNGDGLWTGNTRVGYAGYEAPKYKQEESSETKKTIGSGVYMFDADNGDLLWHANSTSADLSNADLKYSVVSEIKTVDRNNDGYVDHLYFGDLAGQGFRVDFKNDGASKFNAQINKVLNLKKTDGTSPRFYVAPTFTAHRSDGKTEGGDIVVAAFISGNKSSPLLATADSPTLFKSSTGFQFDGVYAIYDYDIYANKSNYPTTNKAARTLAASTETTANSTKLKYINKATAGATINSTTGWGGWYYQFNTKMNGTETTAAIIKGITDMLAIENDLYVTMYDASDNGTTSSCGAGVKGHSFAKRLCLPTGVCAEQADYTYNLGSGIVNLNLGPVGGSQKSIFVPDPTDVCSGPNCKPCVGAACGTGSSPPAYGGPAKLIPKRWYERFAKG